jgi:hypothetical protein
MEFAIANGKECLIAFHPTPYVDVHNRPYINIIRGLCYIHPTDDGGFGDAKHCYDLQNALDDTVNMSNDRTKLATFPLFQVRRFSLEGDDADQFYIEPGHKIPVNEIGDIQEFKIQDNVQGAMQQAAFIISKMQQLDAIWPTTMGGLPEESSTTATAVAGAENRSGARMNFKNMTFSSTFDAELYWMILQMTYQFAQPETGEKLMGDKVYDFDPSRDYYYKPVSSAIESEQGKQMKIQRLREILQTMGPFAQFYANQPQFTQTLNVLLMRMMEYLGEEPANVMKNLLNPQQQPMLPAATGNGMDQGGNVSLTDLLGAPSNQSGAQQTPMEMQARQQAGGVYQ